ncbi:uncharacterized protein EV420DRAFT_1671037 [Desarmillaria tabescens]|uniref:Uncharacterized protein n=1 Tax=Armillaria tabescens TaxID=1929756 RepID=A0AA39N7P4_ARMTA|nr:uncharacterized protein EV420DRAFT_1671037 [Desarmillaria tabescens]KAK0460554.1 hypothetical protein EV420DRAFT_1671037 [Desarmillaria tabescens]
MAETFGTTFGCLLISFMIDVILYGMGLLLVLQYFKKNSKDAFLVKAAVLGLGIFATAHIAGMCAWIYETFITNFSHPELLNELPLSVSIEIMSFTRRQLQYIVSFIAQFRPSQYLDYISNCTGIAQTVTTAQRGTASGIDDEINKIITAIEISAAALCDVLVTITLCVLLRISRTGIKSGFEDGFHLGLLDHPNYQSRSFNESRGSREPGLVLVTAEINVLNIPSMLVFNPSTELYLLSVVGSLNYREHIRAGSRHRKKEWNSFTTTTNDSYSLPLENAGPSSKSIVTWKDPETEIEADEYVSVANMVFKYCSASSQIFNIRTAEHVRLKPDGFRLMKAVIRLSTTKFDFLASPLELAKKSEIRFLYSSRGIDRAGSWQMTTGEISAPYMAKFHKHDHISAEYYREFFTSFGLCTVIFVKISGDQKKPAATRSWRVKTHICAYNLEGPSFRGSRRYTKRQLDTAKLIISCHFHRRRNYNVQTRASYFRSLLMQRTHFVRAISLFSARFDTSTIGITRVLLEQPTGPSSVSEKGKRSKLTVAWRHCRGPIKRSGTMALHLYPPYQRSLCWA